MTSGDMGDRPVAVVDIGSAAVKLLVVDEAGLAAPGAELAHQGAKVPMLADRGRGLGQGALDAMADALDVFAAVLVEHRPTSVAVVGTAWARTGVDLGGLPRLIEDKLGATLEVLSGDREAELSYRGAVAGREFDGPIAVMDLGAGSTEFAVAPGSADGAATSVSLPIGGRVISDAYLAGDPPRPEELSAALSVVELHLDDLRRELPALTEAANTGTIVSVGATRQIAEVEIGFPDPDAETVDGYRLEKAAAEEVFRALATESRHDRGFNPGLRPEDVDDIVGAMCIVVGFMRQFTLTELMVSERGLMHGLAAELLSKR